MATKISLYKSSADGEQLNIEVELTREHFEAMKPRKVGNKLEPGQPLRQQFSHVFELADRRLFEMNLRIMVANQMVKKLSPEAQMAIHSVMEVMHGQRPTPDYAQMVSDAILEVQQNLIKQGYNEKVLNEVIADALPHSKPTPQVTAAKEVPS